MNQSLGGVEGQRGPEACNVLEVEEGGIGFGDVVGVG